MAHAALLVMTSPMLLAPLPPTQAVNASLAQVPTINAPAPIAQPHGQPHNLLPLSWSLTASQDQTQEPGVSQPDERETAEEGDENEIVVEGEYGPREADPVAVFNEQSYRITQDLDAAITGPLAYGYRDGLPGPIRDGLGNAVRNLREPANFLNFLLQFKVGDALETLGRFAINSTVGVGGLFDVAGKDSIGLPYRRNGFANTFGYYGIGTGAYLYLPITGATTVRDLIGDTLDQAVLPIGVGKPFNTPEYGIPYFVVSNLEARLEVDQELERIDATIDPYSARRDTYLYRRARDIALLKGEEPPPPPAILREIEEGLDAIEAEDEEDAGIPVGDAPPIMDDGEGGPQISYEPTLSAPSLAAAVAITQPLTADRTR